MDRLFQTVDQDGTELSHPSIPVHATSPLEGTSDEETPEETKRRIPLLFFQKPLADPRMQETVE